MQYWHKKNEMSDKKVKECDLNVNLMTFRLQKTHGWRVKVDKPGRAIADSYIRCRKTGLGMHNEDKATVTISRFQIVE